LVETSDRGYALAGESSSFDGLWLVKTDVDGNMMWNRTYEERSEDTSLVLTSDGGFAVAGGMGDFWLVKTDNQGNMEWSRTYGGTSNDHAHSLIQTSDGGYAIAGSAGLIRTDAYGNMVWNQTYEGTAHALVQTSDGGYALAGTKNNDFWLAKTDAQGIPEFPSGVILIVTLTVVLVVAVIYRQHIHQHK